MMETIKSESEKWELLINVNKNKCVVISKMDVQLYLDNEPVERVKNFK